MRDFSQIGRDEKLSTVSTGASAGGREGGLTVAVLNVFSTTLSQLKALFTHSTLLIT